MVARRWIRSLQESSIRFTPWKGVWLAESPQSGGREFDPRRAHDNLSVPLWVICVSLCQSIKIKPTNMYITSARAQLKINTHRCWNWHLCIPDGLSVVQCSLGHVIGVVVFLHNFSGMKRTCWTTGSWRSCLSVEVVSSIPTGSTIKLSVPLWVYMRFPLPEHQNQTNKCIRTSNSHHKIVRPVISWILQTKFSVNCESEHQILTL